MDTRFYVCRLDLYFDAVGDASIDNQYFKFELPDLFSGTIA